MDKEELKAYLKDNLRVDFTTHTDMDGSLKLTVYLELEGEVISEGWDYIYDIRKW